MSSHFSFTAAYLPSTPVPDAILMAAKRNQEGILIVDDSQKARSDVIKALPRFRCFEAESFHQAINILQSEDISIVITDVILPGLSGIELLRKVVETYPDKSVIILSDIDRTHRVIDALRLGAYDYLIDPCDPHVLAMTVSQALERNSLVKRARQYKADLEARNIELERKRAELQRLQTQIVHSEKMASLGQLSAGIAHELNNPVGFIYGNLDLLRSSVLDLIDLCAANSSDSEELERIREDVESIISDCRDGASMIRDIVQNLRTFSRLDEAEFKRTDVHEGIVSATRLLSRYFSGGNITLIQDYGEDVPQIDSFSSQLNQVWMNLLVNAAQAVGSGGEVRISTRREEANVLVTVEDNGCGIPKENLDRIFDPFFTTKPVGEGTGLGLSIIFGIIERHGGSIDVESTVGEGTTFTVALPIENISQERALAAAEQ